MSHLFPRKPSPEDTGQDAVASDPAGDAPLKTAWSGGSDSRAVDEHEDAAYPSPAIPNQEPEESFTADNPPPDRGDETAALTQRIESLEEIDALRRRIEALEASAQQIHIDLRFMADRNDRTRSETEAALQLAEDVERHLEDRMHRVEERLTSDLEARLARLAQSYEQAKQQRLEAERLHRIVEAWRVAPLLLRLEFAQSLLTDDHALQAGLKEARELERLRRQGHDLEAWLTKYPSLFADAVESLDGVSGHGQGVTETLVIDVLEEARALFQAHLKALGIEWIVPVAGDALTDACEVVGVEPAEDGPGTVARCRRRGFRWQGRLYLPAQVTRGADTTPGREGRTPQAEIGPTPADERDGSPEPRTRLFEADADAAPARSSQESPPAGTDGGADRWPIWLKTLHRQCINGGAAAISLLDRLDAAVAAADEQRRQPLSPEKIQTLLEPILPLLGTRNIGEQLGLSPEQESIFVEQREALISWLRSALSVETLLPTGGAAFDAATMTEVDTRRTVHPHEDQTVARVLRAGLMRQGAPILRAEVIRYDLGGGQ